MHPSEPAPSYRALLAVPTLGRILLGMTLSRIGGSMFGVAIVLFTLDRYDSPALAGIVTFASVAPGLLVSPIAGALLDRHGRAKLIILDQVVGAASLVLIAGLALADALPPPVLVLVTAVAGITAPLSSVGLRSLFPLLVRGRSGSASTRWIPTGTSLPRSSDRPLPGCWCSWWVDPRRWSSSRCCSACPPSCSSAWPTRTT
jgi:MFS family permease